MFVGERRLELLQWSATTCPPEEAMFYPRLADGGGDSKVPSLGVSFSLDRGGERCVVHLPLGASVSRSVPQELFELCVNVNFRCCPGPLKHDTPFPTPDPPI